MFRKNIYIVIVIIFAFFNCNQANDKIEKNRNNSIIDKITIEETEDVIFTSITQVSLNSNGSMMLISDYNGRTIALYNTNTGKLIRQFKSKLSYSDSLAIKGKPWQSEYEYILNKDIVDTNQNPVKNEFLENYLHNEYKSAIFCNDSTIAVMGNIYTFKKKINEEFNPRSMKIALSAAIILYDINSDKIEFIAPTNLYSSFARPDIQSFDTNDNTFIIQSLNHPAAKNRQKDSIHTLAKYDMSGNYLSPFLDLPEEYISTGIYYSLMYDPMIVSLGNSWIHAFPLIEKIYSNNGATLFNLIGLPESNNQYIEEFIKNNQLVGERLKRYKSFIPNTLSGIFIKKNNNIIVSVFHVNEDDDFRVRILQEYSPSGELIKQFILHLVDHDGIIHYIHYCPQTDNFLVFRKSDVKWTLQLVKVD